jgi:DHA1 family tetracycline resistance protein-like MFS transporter
MHTYFTLYTLLTVVFIDWLGVGLVYPMFSAMLFSSDAHLLSAAADAATRATCLGILLACMPLTQFFSAPLLGQLSDRIGRRSLILSCLIVGITGYLLALVAVGYAWLWLLLLSRIFIGISAGSTALVAASLADLSKGDEQVKARFFGLYNMAMGLGFMVGPFVGGRLSHTLLLGLKPYMLPFAIATAVLLVSFIMVVLVMQETAQVRRAPSEKGYNVLRQLTRAYSWPGLRRLFLAFFIFCLGWSFYWEFISVYLMRAHQFTTVTIGTVYAYGAAMYALSCGFLIQGVVKRFGARLIFPAALALGGLSIAVLLLPFPLWMWWLMMPIQQYMVALIFPTITTLISNASPADQQGEALGVMQSVDAFSCALSPLCGGWLLALTVKMPMIIGATAFLGASGIMGYALYTASGSETQA